MYCLRETPAEILNIRECVNGKDGNLYEHNMAERTPKNHKYVPWIHVDGVHDEGKENQIIESLIDFLKNLSNENKVKFLE